MLITYIHYLCSDDTALTHVTQFACAARELGHHVEVLAMNDCVAASPGDGSSGLQGRAIEVFKMPLRRYLHEPKELLWNVRYFGQELHLVRNSRPDLLLVRNHLLTVSSVAVAGYLDLPLVLEVNSPASQSRQYLDQYAHLPAIPEYLEGWKLRRSDAVTVVSSALKEHFEDFYGIDSNKLFVVPNGADTQSFSPMIQPDPALPPEFQNAPVIGFCGSFKSWHGVELLDAVFVKIARSHPDARFVLIGSSAEDDKAVSDLKMKLGERLFVAGRVPHDRVPSLVAGFQIGVMPESNPHGSPLKVIEYMAAGKAVVAPDYGPLREIIEHGVQGLLFPPGDVAMLFNCVDSLIRSPELAARIGAAASKHVASNLTWRKNAARVISACEAAMDSKRQVA